MYFNFLLELMLSNHGQLIKEAGEMNVKFLAISIIAALAFTTSLADAEAFKVAVNPAPPYRIIEGDRFEGIYIDVAREAARRSGIEIAFENLPLNRALKMMEDGEADMMLGPNRTPEREAFMLFLDHPLPEEDKVFLIRPNGNDIKSFAELRSIQVAVLRGAKYSPEFDGAADIRKTEVNSYENGLKMVEVGNAGAVVIPRLQGDWLVKESKSPLKPASLQIKGAPSFVTVAKKSKLAERKAELEAALGALGADGTLSTILARYR